jgi:hypothetical protein
MAYGKAKVELYSFLTLALDGSEWLVSLAGHFTTAVRAPAAHRVGDFGGHLHIVEEKKFLTLLWIELLFEFPNPSLPPQRDYFLLGFV